MDISCPEDSAVLLSSAAMVPEPYEGHDTDVLLVAQCADIYFLLSDQL